MHILLVTHYFAPEPGAPQRRWSALIERFADAGHEVTVLAPAPHYPGGRVPRRYRRELRAGSVQRPRDGVTIRRVAHLAHRGDIVSRSVDHFVTAVASIAAAPRLRFAGSRPNVVVATAPAIESLVAGRVIARRMRVPFVAEMRDAWPDLVAFTPGLARGSSPTAVVKRWVHRRVTAMQAGAALVVTTTESFARVLNERGITAVRVLRNGTTHTELSPIGPSTREAGPLRVLYMGTVGRSQGLEVVVDAVAQLRREGVSVEARIVGDGAGLAQLRKRNRAVGTPVEIRDAVLPSEVREHYEWADSTIVSLRDWEPFGWTVPSKLYELMAAGRHITALVAGEAAELVTSTEAGMVVPPGDAAALTEAWRRIAADRAALQINGNGREWARQNADYDSLAAAYASLLEGVSANGAP